jgi:2-dehydropantoate 2-reductase
MTESKNMKIAVVGPGALGSVFAALLAHAQVVLPETEQDEIWLVGRNASNSHLTKIHEQGLRIELSPHAIRQVGEKQAEILSKPVNNLRIGGLDGYPENCHLALVLVKSFDTSKAAATIKKIMATDGLAVSLQNGLGNVETLADALGRERVCPGSTLIGANLGEPGVVRLAGLNTTYFAAETQPGSVRLGYLQRLTGHLERSVAPVELAKDLSEVIWSKLVINCAVNPVAALLDVTNGALLESEAVRGLMSELAAEVVQLARTLGVNLPFDEADAARRAFKACEINATNYNSMVQDMRHSSSTEIEAMNGAVERLGAQYGIPVPANRALANLVRAKKSFLVPVR